MYIKKFRLGITTQAESTIIFFKLPSAWLVLHLNLAFALSFILCVNCTCSVCKFTGSWHSTCKSCKRYNLQKSNWSETPPKREFKEYYGIFRFGQDTSLSHAAISNGKTGNKNVQLVLQHCCRTSGKTMLRVLPATDQTCLATNQVVAGWTKLRASHAIHGSYVTCCKTSLSWGGKTRNMHRFCCKK